jgi:hypothetical protein
MSKKSEQDAQVRKQRAAALRGPKPASAAVSIGEHRKDVPAGIFRQRPRWQVLSIKVVLALVGLSFLSGLLSLIFPPLVPTPPAFMVSILPQLGIVNQSLLPIHGLRYTCELSSVADQSGFTVRQDAAAASPPQTASILYPRQQVPVECRGQVDLRGIRIKTSELKVSISYFHLGWPLRRHAEYMVKGDFDATGSLRRWVVE